MTSPKYPGWDIAEITQPGQRRRWIMVRSDLGNWIVVTQYGRQFAATVYNPEAKVIRGGLPVEKAVEWAEF